MTKQAERSLWGAVSVALAVSLVFLIVSALGAITPSPEEPTPQQTFKGHPLDKLDRELTLGERGASVLMGEEVRVIIRLNTQSSHSGSGVGAASSSSFDQAKGEVLGLLRTGVGGVSEQQVKELHIINAIALTMPTKKLNDLAYLDAVAYVSQDKQVHALVDDSVPLVGAPQVWAMNDSNNFNVTGRNITIVIIDSGIDYTHPDLGNCNSSTFLAGNCSKVIAGYDWVNSDGDPFDDSGHGTHVAGIAAANGTLKGMAPDALLVAYKVLDSNGNGWISDVILAIENATTAGYDIISLSMGTSGNPNDDLSLAADNAVNAGVIVVAAAGNSGPDLKSIRSPGNSRKAITVGNTYKNDSIRSSSSRGPTSISNDIKPDLVAPGVNIYSTVPTGGCNDCDASGYKNKTGTSMSAPHVSGAAALLKQLHPDWSPETIKGALIGYTKDVGLRAVDQGSGRLLINESINAPIIGGKPSRSLGTVSTDVVNLTATINITNMLNESINVTLNVTIVTNNASASLNQSNVSIAANSTANIELFVNWSQGLEGYVDGRISADNLTIPFILEITGYRTVVIEDIGGNEIRDALVRNIDNDGLNEILMSYDESGGFSRVRYAKYNHTANSWNLSTISTVWFNDVVEAGDVNNDGLNEVISGDWGSMFRIYEYNVSDASWIEIYNYTTDATSVEKFMEIADVDNDSITEVLVTSYNNSDNGKIWQFKIINGTWNVTVLHKMVLGDRFYGMTVGDVDNDGLLEIVWHNYTSNTNYIVVGNYVNGTWNHSTIDIFPGTTSNQVQGITIADPDEDGENEIIVSGGNTTHTWIKLYNYNGSTTWNVSEIYNDSLGSAFPSAVGDANNDGKVDIVFGVRNGNGVRILERQPDNLTWIASIVGKDFAGGALVRGVDIGDATNNGLNEITSGSGFVGDAIARLHSIIDDPRISNLQLSVAQPTKLDTQTIQSRIQDSDGLNTVELLWRNGTVDWTTVNMSLLDTQNYSAQVPVQAWNTTVEYFIIATDGQGDLNQTPILNYTVLVNRQGNETDVLTNLTNLTVWIANSTALNATYYGAEQVEILWNGSLLVEFNFTFPYEVLDLRNVTINASQDNLTGWVHVRNLSLPTGVNKTLYIDQLNSSADAVCLLDADVNSIDNISADCTGANETLVICNNVTAGNYRCENISGRWKLSGASYTAAKEQENPAPQLSGLGPSGTVASSSTTLTVTTDENATCKYSTTSQSYAAMPSTFSTTGATSHTQGLSSLSNAAYTYYVRCQDAYSKESSEGTISFTISVSSGGGGGGGGGGRVPSDPNKKSVTFNNPQIDREHVMHVTSSGLAVTKAAFVNTDKVPKTIFTVQSFNESLLTNPKEDVYQYLNITLTNLYVHELSDAWIQFKVNKSWFSGKEIDDVRLFRLQSSWKELETTWIKDTETAHYFNATTPGFSLFAIALVQPEPVVNVTVEPDINQSVEPQINQSVNPVVNETDQNATVIPPPPPERKLWQWLVGVVVFLLAVGVVFIKFRLDPPKAKSSQGSLGGLRDYIRKSREQGFSDEQIKQKLVESGWNQEMVDVGMQNKP